MKLQHQYEVLCGLALAKVGRRAYDDDGALTTEMMIITAVLSLIAVAAVAILTTKLGEAAENIDTDPTDN